MDPIQTVDPDIPLSHEEVEIVARKVFGKSFSKLMRYQVNNYSDSKLGFVGLYNRLILTVRQNNNEVSEISLFVKSESQEIKIERNIYEDECNFYSNIVPEMQKKCIVDKWAPECYYSKNELLVMEDLKNFSVVLKNF